MMDNYYKTTLRTLAGLGINLGHFKNKFIKIIMLINLVVSFLTLLQECLFLIDEKQLMIQRTCVVPCILNVFEAAFKYCNGIYHDDKIKKVMDSLDEVYEKMEEDEKARFKTASFKLRRLAVFFGSTNMIVVWIFNLFPIIMMLKIYIQMGVVVYLYPFFFWWPFNSTDYFISTYLYQVYCGQMATLQILIFDVLYMMILCQIIVHYRHLSASFNKLIDDLARSPSKESKARFNYLVEVQLKLNADVDLMNRIYGAPLLLHVLLASLIICFTGLLMVTESEVLVLIQFCSVGIISLIHTYVLCWFGDQIEKEVNFHARLRFVGKFFVICLELQPCNADLQQPVLRSRHENAKKFNDGANESAGC